ncbi:DUF4956 domain-containing protein [Chloroflexota bacterium]
MTWQDILDLVGGGIPLSPVDISVALGFALICSIVAVLMYNYFYGSQNIGAGVQRSFLLMGPAITAIFLGIQFSLPLSLGLLGALSIIRFRTPVKDPAEIGFVMLLIAAAIGSATFNYLLVGILFVFAFLSLLGLRIARRHSGEGRGSLIVTLDSPDYTKLEGKLTSFITGKLRGVRLESISTLADATSLHYQFNKRAGFEWGVFTGELSEVAAPAKVQIFIG